MRTIENNIDAAGARQRRDFSYGHNDTIAVADMCQQNQADSRMGIQRRFVCANKAILGGRFRQSDFMNLSTAPALESPHGRLHAVIVEITEKDTVTGHKAVITANESLQSFGRIAREGNFIRVHTK